MSYFYFLPSFVFGVFKFLLIFFFADYKFVGRMGEGTFSEVLKCQNALDSKLYACKKMKQKYDRYFYK